MIVLDFVAVRLRPVPGCAEGAGTMRQVPPNQWSSAVANTKKSRQSGRGQASRQAASKQAASKQAASKQAARDRVTAMRAQAKRAERRRNLLMIGAIAAVVVLIGGGVAWYAASRGGTSSTSAEVVPAAPSGTPQTEPAAHVVANTTGISGVVAYNTAGWPTASKNGPANQALGHNHVTGPVTYSVTPPVGGDHNPTPMTCGVYTKPVPNEYAVHDMEHGAIWITYQPSLSQSEVSQLKSFVGRQTVLTPAGGKGSRYMDLTPYPGLPSPIVVSSWGFQLRLSSPTDPRLQQFVNKFRFSQQYTPEYGGECTGGAGTPAAT
jgi:hypothetical protein